MNFNKKDIEAAWQLIKDSQNIVLLTHFKPDGDGIACCLAFEKILHKFNKSNVETIYPDKPNFAYSRQPKNILIGEHTKKPDLIIVFDAAIRDLIYFHPDFEKVSIINIDHHVSNSNYGTYNFVDTNTSSASEVLFNLINKWDDSLFDKDVAEALLYGILYDSQVFQTQSTQPSTLRIAADLMDRGADLFTLKVELFSNKNPKIIKLWEAFLGRIEISKNGTVAWSYMLQKDLKDFDLDLSSAVGFNNFLSGISEIDVTLFFYETEDGQTKVSLRSKEYDVNKLALNFGGGGHVNAAGILSKKPMQELMKEVVDFIQ
jgi:phosphoesterase RecJ-like protein